LNEHNLQILENALQSDNTVLHIRGALEQKDYLHSTSDRTGVQEGFSFG
jgi:hypothetical protein